ncbi:MAG TPA: hypothetical protein PKU96_04760 [bacterium]|nr:hypothetical protein [bacterium]
MMKTITLLVALLLASIATPASAANEAKIIFWYPGEAGNTAEAQPLIDLFCDTINAQIKPFSVSGKYFNSVAGGLEFIWKEHPQLAIISHPALVQEGAKLGKYETILATLPEPSGKPLEQYSLVGATPTLQDGAEIVTSEPLSENFIREYLFPNLPQKISLRSSSQILLELQQIGSGKKKGYAILTPSEAFSLKRIPSAWSKSIKFISHSKEVPSASLVSFDNSWKGIAQLKAVLLRLSSNPANSELLGELRLKGFAER